MALVASPLSIGVGEVPLGHVAGVAEVGLDMREAEWRRSDRSTGAFAPVRRRGPRRHRPGPRSAGRSPRSIVTRYSANFASTKATRSWEREPTFTSTTSAAALTSLFALVPTTASDEHRVRRRVRHPGQYRRDLVGDERLGVAHDDNPPAHEEGRGVERLQHPRHDRFGAGGGDVLRGEVLEREGGIEVTQGAHDDVVQGVVDHRGVGAHHGEGGRHH